MKRYTIIVREYGSDHNVELLEVDDNPKDVAAGLAKKLLTVKSRDGHRRLKTPRYTYIFTRDNGVGPAPEVTDAESRD